MIYLFIFLICCILLALSKSSVNAEITEKNNSLTKFSLFITFFLLWGLAAFRYNVGTDYKVYSLVHFPRVLAGESGVWEPLSTLLVYIGNFIYGYVGIFALIHLIILSFLLVAIYDSSENITFSMSLLFLTGFFNISLNLMRQSIVIAIFLFSIQYIFKRDFKKYLLFMIIAFLFHKTAVFYFPMYFLYNLKFNTKRLCFIAIMILPVSYLLNFLLNFLTQYFDVYRNYWGSVEMLASNSTSGTLTILNIYILLMFFLIRSLARNITGEIKKKSDLYIYIQLISLVVIIFSNNFYLPNFDRILLLFTATQIISIPFFFKQKFNTYFKVLLFIFTIIIYCIAFYQLYYLKNTTGTFPYQTFF